MAKAANIARYPVSPIMFEVLGRWWLQHGNPRFLFPDVGRAWKEKYGCAKRAQHVAKQPMSDSSVQQAMSRAAHFRNRLREQIAQHEAQQKTKHLSQIEASVWTMKWIIHSKAVDRGQSDLRYLARHVKKSALSEQRLLGCDEQGNIKLNCQDSTTDKWPTSSSTARTARQASGTSSSSRRMSSFADGVCMYCPKA